jgi:hypothetical protein
MNLLKTPPDDRLALVSFSSSAKVVANLTQTTKAGKTSLIAAVDNLRPDASTNLWDGLKTGMNLLNSEQAVSTETAENRLQAVFILTDGMPNVEPPRGHIPMLKQYLEANPHTRFNVNTFGFGYSLDSKLLSDLANVGGGSYGFIPDAGMVGTVFVHAVANLLATYSTRATLSVEVPEGIKLKSLRGSYPVKEASWGSQIEIGDIQYGQIRDFILEFEGTSTTGNSDITVSLTARPWYANSPETHSGTATPSIPTLSPSDNYLAAKYRLDLVSYIYRLCAMNPNSILNSDAPNYFSTTAAEIRRLAPNHEGSRGLATDMEGELTLAVTQNQNWKKWGIHYFPSLARSHQRQQCGNFKDAGLQGYGKNSPLFIQSRDMVDAAFDNLPPPKPSKRVVTQPAAPGRRGVNYQQLYSMSQYNSSVGPCFTGECPVNIAEGGTTLVNEIRRGTPIQTRQGVRRVIAVVKTRVPSGQLPLCKIGDNLRVTPWHPILHEERWVFPADIVTPEIGEAEYIYSFLLQPSSQVDSHSMTVGGVPCVTLGHGIIDKDSETNSRLTPKVAEGDARIHPFFGEYDTILHLLSLLPNFHDDEGVVECAGVERDSDGLVCGFLAPPPPEEQSVEPSTA